MDELEGMGEEMIQGEVGETTPVQKLLQVVDGSGDLPVFKVSRDEVILIGYEVKDIKKLVPLAKEILNIFQDKPNTEPRIGFKHG